MVFSCAICLESLEWVLPEHADLRPCAITCGHTFHFGCIKKWWIRLYKDARQQFIQGALPPVHCPICRHTEDVPTFFELIFLVKDDELFCTESEMNESIILQQNIEEIMEECKQIKKNVNIINKDIHNEEKIKANLRAELKKAMKEKKNFQALMEKKVQSIYTKQSLGQQTSSTVSKRRVKVPLLLEEFNKENNQIHSKKIRKKTRRKQGRYYGQNNAQEIINIIRIPQISGKLYDDMNEEEKEDEKNRLRKAMSEGVDWIIIELREFQIEPKKLIAYAHHVHIFGSIADMCSIVSSYVWPQYRFTYIPFTIVSTIGAVYFNTYNHRLVSQYKVEKDKVQLARFPMKRFPKTTIVLKKQPNASIRIRNCLTVGIALLYTCYNLWNPSPAPPCVYKWEVWNFLKELVKINLYKQIFIFVLIKIFKNRYE